MVEAERSFLIYHFLLIHHCKYVFSKLEISSFQLSTLTFGEIKGYPRENQ